MAKHIRIIGEPMDKLDSRNYGVTLVWKKLENGAMLAADDYTMIHKCDRRGRILAANRRRPESSPVAKIPEGEGGIIEDCGNSGMANVELEGNEGLSHDISFSTQKQRDLWLTAGILKG